MQNQLQLIDYSLPIGSFEAYVSWANRIPMLTLEQEQEYARQLSDENSVEAARQLVLPHLRYVVKVARGYLGYGLPLADLVQEGNVGLMKAVKRFDPDVGVRLVSFAVHWIKAEIHEYILKNWRIVKVATTKAQRKLFFNLRSAKKRLGWAGRDEIHAIAQDLGVSARDVELMEQRMNAHDAGFDGDWNDEEDGSTNIAPAQYLESPNSDPALHLEEDTTAQTDKERLITALQNLDKRSYDILQARWLNDQKATLHDLADKYQVSAERVRQIENAAMKKIRQVLEH